MATPHPDDIAYAARVADYLSRRHGWLPEVAVRNLTLYKESLERFGTKARSRAPSLGLLKGDWGKVRGAILEVNDRDRASGRRPPAKPRHRIVHKPFDPVPGWARQPGAPDWMVLSMKPGTSIWGKPGWFGEVEGRSGHWFAFSKLSGESSWYADAHFGPRYEPIFSHGEGDRTVGKQVAKAALAQILDRAEALASQGVAGPYDPRLLGPVDAPGQQRLFNHPEREANPSSDLEYFERHGFVFPSDIPAGYEDTSWHNDAAASFFWPAQRMKLWVDHPDPERREIGGDRYSVVRTDEEGNTDLDIDPLFTSEEWEPTKSFIERALRHSNPGGAAAAWDALERMTPEQARDFLS